MRTDTNVSSERKPLRSGKSRPQVQSQGNWPAKVRNVSKVVGLRRNVHRHLFSGSNPHWVKSDGLARATLDCVFRLPITS